MNTTKKIDLEALAKAEALTHPDSVYQQIVFSRSLGFLDLEFSLQKLYLELVSKYKLLELQK